jgi:hypothetical protein
MPANKHHGKTVHAEPVILAIVGTETGIWNAIAVVTATLLPGAVLRLPVMCTITLPSDVLLAYLSRAPLSCRPVALLLTLLALLTLLPSGLLLRFLLLLLWGPSLLLRFLLLLLWGPSLPLHFLLLLLWGPSLLLRFLLLRFLLLLLRGASLLLRFLLLLLRGASLLLRSLLLLLRGLSVSFLFLRFPLPCVSRRGDSEKQKHG